MSPRYLVLAAAGLLALGACAEDTTEPPTFASARSSGMVAINVVLKGRATGAQIAQLNTIGRVKTTFPEVNGLTMAAKADRLDDVRALRFVKGAALDQQVYFPPPTDLVEVEDFTGGFSTWDQDGINAAVIPLSGRRSST